jgi:hypothetical protein
MSTRYKDGSHYENHQRAEELHDNAAHAHRTAEESHEKQDHQTGPQQTRQALEHSQPAHQHPGHASQNGINEHGFANFGHDDIAALAHQKWLARGCPEGSPEEDWFAAARELRDRKESRQK